MPDEKPDDKPKMDRFKPAVPQIPGVPDPNAPLAPGAPAQAKPQIPKQWLMIGGGAVGLVLLIVILVFALRTEPPPVAPSAAPAATDPASPAATAAASPAATSPASTPVAPGEIAAVQEFAKPWATKRFRFRKFTDEVAALIVRLPSGSARAASGYWAFSTGRVGDRCELEFITDLAVLSRDYGFRAQHPMVVDPCNRSVFDPLKLGDAGGAWVRGDVVKGSAYRPPLSILVRIQGDTISAVQME